jgi:hypothetical protein
MKVSPYEYCKLTVLMVVKVKLVCTIDSYNGFLFKSMSSIYKSFCFTVKNRDEFDLTAESRQYFFLFLVTDDVSLQCTE